MVVQVFDLKGKSMDFWGGGSGFGDDRMSLCILDSMYEWQTVAAIC